jgi:hypothetical protein
MLGVSLKNADQSEDLSLSFPTSSSPQQTPFHFQIGQGGSRSYLMDFSKNLNDLWFLQGQAATLQEKKSYWVWDNQGTYQTQDDRFSSLSPLEKKHHAQLSLTHPATLIELKWDQSQQDFLEDHRINPHRQSHRWETNASYALPYGYLPLSLNGTWIQQRTHTSRQRPSPQTVFHLADKKAFLLSSETNKKLSWGGHILYQEENIRRTLKAKPQGVLHPLHKTEHQSAYQRRLWEMLFHQTFQKKQDQFIIEQTLYGEWQLSKDRSPLKEENPYDNRPVISKTRKNYSLNPHGNFSFRPIHSIPIWGILSHSLLFHETAPGIHQLYGDDLFLQSNPQLQSEKGWQGELRWGFKYSPQEKYKTQLLFAHFHEETKQGPLLVLTSPSQQRYINGEGSWNQGTRLEFTQHIFSGQISWSYEKQRPLNASERYGLRGKFLPYRPLTTQTLTIAWKNETLNFSLEAKQRGKTFLNTTNSLSQRPPLSIDVNVSYSFPLLSKKADSTLSLMGKNLFTSPQKSPIVHSYQSSEGHGLYAYQPLLQPRWTLQWDVSF